jgi:hypothetical protein
VELVSLSKQGCEDAHGSSAPPSLMEAAVADVITA